jgi:hypothetical protein
MVGPAAGLDSIGVGLFQYGRLERMEVGGRDKDLVATFQQPFLQVSLSLGVELGKDIVQEDHWLLPALLLEPFNLGQFQCDGSGALLSSGTVDSHVDIAKEKAHIVSMGAHHSGTTLYLLGPPVSQRLAKGIGHAGLVLVRRTGDPVQVGQGKGLGNAG